MLNKRGFTLMEALIAASVFGMLSVIAATFFLNISQSQRSTDSYSALYEDARVIMENIANEIRNGTVDYEEYFNITSDANGTEGGIAATDRYYGINRGVYASRFYDPGYRLKDDGTFMQGYNAADLGVECLGEDGKKIDCPGGVSIFSLSVDKDMGKNPYDGVNEANVSAINDNKNDQPELYLISKDGRNKTIIKTQSINTSDHILSILRLTGKDTDSNGVIDGFFCNEPTGCEIASIPPYDAISGLNEYVSKKDSSNTFSISSAFTPISPFRSNVKDIHFIITPTEDPYKAFDEKAVQIHPSVTIVMTLEPSTKEKENLPTEQQNQSITVQTTVSAGVTSRIKTYPPTKDLIWIQNVVSSI